MHVVYALQHAAVLLISSSLLYHAAGELAAAQAALAKGAVPSQTPAPQPAGSTAAAPAAAGIPLAGSAAAAAGADSLWTLADITARTEEFRKALSRGVLAGKGLELRAVLMVEAPADAAHMTVSLGFRF
jgi:hypothetical protein